MNRKLLCIISIMGLTIISLTGCKKKDSPPSLPQLTTAAVTDISGITGKSGGTITSNGGRTISFNGIAWSKTNQSPSISDDTTKSIGGSGSFVSTLNNIEPSSTYYVRAYAINEVGVGYGNVVTFTTGNGAPEVRNVSISGTTDVGSTLTAAYDYFDYENDAEGETAFQWYVASDASGTGETIIADATESTYFITDADENKYIRVSITPKSVAGTTNGVETKSGYFGAVGDPTTVTFTYNSNEVTYQILTSSTTGRKWLDRNLGAPNVATSIDDYQNYGDLFQWGRLADGHQLIQRNGPNDTDMSGITGATDPGNEQFSNTDIPSINLFMLSNTPPGDWRIPQNDMLWQGFNGLNNPCPAGWRVPTIAEWKAENISSIIDGFAKLKLTKTGLRSGLDASFLTSATVGSYWSSSIGVVEAVKIIRARFDAATFTTSEHIRVNANACRCIKN